MPWHVDDCDDAADIVVAVAAVDPTDPQPWIIKQDSFR